MSHGALEKIRRPRRMPAPRILLKRTWRGSGSSPSLLSGERASQVCLKRLRSCSFRLQRSHRRSGPIVAQVPGPRDVVYCGNSSLASSASCRALKRGRLWTAEARGAGSGRWARGQRGLRDRAHRTRWAADLPNPVKKGDACPRPGRAGKRDSR